MGSPEQKPTKAFMSYAWTTLKHEEWVINLASRLREDGVDVILDKWDLKQGQNTFAFMERMVTSSDIDKVLIICDKGYRDKADSRSGGVGTETHLITPEVYGNVEQEKFIPIIAEKDEQGSAFLPAYIKGLMYVDLSSPERFESGYEDLLRNLHKAPLYRKPALGKAPAHLFESEVSHYQTSNIIAQLQYAIEHRPKRVKGLLRAFTSTFIQEIQVLELGSIEDANDLHELVMDKIERSEPLRNEFLKLLNMLCEEGEVDPEWLVSFFEETYPATEFQGNGSFYEMQFDPFKYLVQELMIYTCGILVKNELFAELGVFLNSEFHIFSSRTRQIMTFSDFRKYANSFELQKQKTGSRNHSLQADKYIQKVNFEYLTSSEFVEADELLYFVSTLQKKDTYPWFPVTYIYHSRGDRTRHNVISKLRSKRYANKVKELFMCESIEQLKELFASFPRGTDASRGYSNGAAPIPSVLSFVKVEDIGVAL